MWCSVFLPPIYTCCVGYLMSTHRHVHNTLPTPVANIFHLVVKGNKYNFGILIVYFFVISSFREDNERCPFKLNLDGRKAWLKGICKTVLHFKNNEIV